MSNNCHRGPGCGREKNRSDRGKGNRSEGDTKPYGKKFLRNTLFVVDLIRFSRSLSVSIYIYMYVIATGQNTAIDPGT